MIKVEYLEDLPREEWRGKSTYSLFKCHCGTIYSARLSSVKCGDSKSCGCLKRSANKTHGLRKSRQYDAWANMKSRCNNPKLDSYKYYGGRGITYDVSWEKFENFWKDMGDTYSDELELDRINPNLGYFKENCRWVNSSVQSYNRNTQQNNNSKKTGVFFYDRLLKWIAYINVNNTRKYLGSFIDFESAAEAREKAEIEHFGFKVIKPIQDL